MTNVVNGGDVLTAFLVGAAFLCGLAYEIAGLTVPGWHTFSYSAHRSTLVRGSILGSVLGLFLILAIHFAQPIGR